MNIDIYSATTYLPVQVAENLREAEFIIGRDTDLFYFVPDHQEYLDRLNTNYGDL